MTDDDATTRTPMDSGLCCMVRHANAVPPWTCDCICHIADLSDDATTDQMRLTAEPARWQRFNDTTGALTWNHRPASEHPDRCVCQGDESTPHTHYPDAPHGCARCGRCAAYRPAVADPARPRVDRAVRRYRRDGELMMQDPNGSYVEIEDYQRLHAEVAALQTERDTLRRERDEAREHFDRHVEWATSESDKWVAHVHRYSERVQALEVELREARDLSGFLSRVDEVVAVEQELAALRAQLGQLCEKWRRKAGETATAAQEHRRMGREKSKHFLCGVETGLLEAANALHGAIPATVKVKDG